MEEGYVPVRRDPGLQQGRSRGFLHPRNAGADRGDRRHRAAELWHHARRWPTCRSPSSATPGSEPDAAWRKAAEARIEKIRKGDLTVLVKDAAGKPVPGAEVAVRMKKHAFLWGTAVSASAFSNGRMTPENLATLQAGDPQELQLRGDGEREQVAAVGQRGQPPGHHHGDRLAARQRPDRSAATTWCGPPGTTRT